MAINLSALDMFRTANNWTADSIANLDGGAIKKAGEYKGFLGSLGRTKIEKAANNEMRTELLKALGTAFGVNGMSEKDGKVRFTRNFLAKLEKILGADFKRDDFKLDVEGYVASGRPLTARRIKAILSKASDAVLKPETKPDTISEDTDSDGEIETFSSKTEKTGKTAKAAGPSRTGGLRKEAVYGPYMEKLATIQKEVAHEDEHVVAFFKRVATTLDYLYEELDVERRAPEAPDCSALRLDQALEFERELGDAPLDEPGKFEYYDNKSGEFKPFKADEFSKFLWDRLGGGLLHTERSKFANGVSPDIAPLKKYVIDNARLFVMKSIDLYFASKEAGKLNSYFAYLQEPGACIEQQCINMIGFEEKNLVKPSTMSAEEVRALNLIADGKAADLPEDTVNQFMDVLEDFEGEKFFSKEKGWNKEVSDRVKAQLRGKRCTMQDFDAPHKLGEKVPELIGESGLPVVKVLTDELIDELGPKVLKEYFR